MTEHELLALIDPFQRGDFHTQDEVDAAYDALLRNASGVLKVIFEQRELVDPSVLLEKGRAKHREEHRVFSAGSQGVAVKHLLKEK